MHNELIKNISIIFLTYNEEVNISQALKSIGNWTEEIIVLDSGSTHHN